MKEKLLIYEGNITFEYLVQRKDVKYMRLKLKNDGALVLSAPYLATKGSINKFLKNNEEWVKEKKAEYERKKSIFPSFEREEEFFLLAGKQAKVRFQKGDEGHSFIDDTLIISTNSDDKQEKRRVFEEFYTEFAYSILKNRFDAVFKERFSDYKQRPALAVKKMKNSFGRAYVNKNLVTLNVFLASMPIEQIDYVAAHELTHFLCPHHQKGFYDELWLRMEDHKEREDYLKKNFLPNY